MTTRLDFGQLVRTLPMVARIAVETAIRQESHLSDDEPNKWVLVQLVGAVDAVGTQLFQHSHKEMGQTGEVASRLRMQPLFPRFLTDRHGFLSLVVRLPIEVKPRIVLEFE